MSVIDVSEKLITCRPSGEFTIDLKVGDLVRPTVPRSNTAVLPFVNPNGSPTKSGVFFSNEVSNALTSLGVDTLERDKLVSILGEQLLQLKLTEGDANRIGKLLGAATLVTGTISEKPSEQKTCVVSVRVLDVRTGQVIKTLDADVPTKDIDRGLVNGLSLLTPTRVGVTNGSFIAIKSFNEGRRSATFSVSADASKVEVSFDVRREGRSFGLRVPGHEGKLLINDTIVVQYVGQKTKVISGQRRPFDVYRFVDGTEVESSHSDSLRGKIDITQFVKLGEENTIVYSHQARLKPAVRIWISK